MGFHLSWLYAWEWNCRVIRKFFPGGAGGKKKLPAKAGDVRDMGSSPGSGRLPGGELGNHSSVLTWRISWAEEPGGLWSIGLQRVGHYWSELARKEILSLTFWGTANLCYTATFSPEIYEGSNFSTPSPTLFFCLKNCNYPSRCEVVSHCGSELHFPDD